MMDNLSEDEVRAIISLRIVRLKAAVDDLETADVSRVRKKLRRSRGDRMLRALQNLESAVKAFAIHVDEYDHQMTAPPEELTKG